MEKLQLDVPKMYADHHVVVVRDVLTKLEGIETVYASSAWKQVLVTYDGARIDAAAIANALADAGYPTDDGGTPVLAQPARLHRDPKWSVLGARMTVTNKADIEMSGEFRRY